MQQRPLDVVLYWHMHQPEYRDLRNRVSPQTWTYLHMIKDYVDMAAHLEQNVKARAVVNSVPVLLDQFNDYHIQLDDYLNKGAAMRDHLLASLADPIVVREHEHHSIKHFSPYQKLVIMTAHILKYESTLPDYDDQFIFDLLVWYHLTWMGETVRRNSLTASNAHIAPKKCTHSAYNPGKNDISWFFRDDGISDMIGFKFQDSHADDAMANIVETLNRVRKACRDHPAPIVSIILDGENAWEHYPEKGYSFLSGPYKKPGTQESLNLTTHSEELKNNQDPQPLQQLVAGGWVYGSFSTWTGSTDNNRARDMPVEGKHLCDKVIQQGTLSPRLERARLQLATCESSDWFWWFGDYNPSGSAAAFDERYRLYPGNLYHYLQQEPSEYLSHAFSTGNQASLSTGVVLPGKQN